MKEKFGEWWLDVAKYIFTGVILSSVFSDVDDKVYLYVWGFMLAVSCLAIGLYFLHKYDKDTKNKKGKKK